MIVNTKLVYYIPHKSTTVMITMMLLIYIKSSYLADSNTSVNLLNDWQRPESINAT